MSKRSTYYATGNRIIQAVSSLMDEMPIDKINVTKVCQRAEINRSTFYDHFKTIEDAISLVDKKIMSRFRLILSEENTIGHNLFLKIFTLIDENREYFSNFYSLGNKIRFAEYFSVLYSDCVSPSGRYVARFWDSGLNAVIKSWLLDGVNKNAIEMVMLFTIYMDNKTK